MQARYFDLATRRHEDERSEVRMDSNLRSKLLIAPGTNSECSWDYGVIRLVRRR